MTCAKRQNYCEICGSINYYAVPRPGFGQEHYDPHCHGDGTNPPKVN